MGHKHANCVKCGSELTKAQRRNSHAFCSKECKGTIAIAVDCCVCGKPVKRGIRELAKRGKACCGLSCQRTLINQSGLSASCLRYQLIELRKSLKKCREILNEIDSIRRCKRCGKYTKRKKFCSSICGNRHKKRRRRALMADAMTDNSISEHEIYQRDGYKCWICNRDVVDAYDNTNPLQATLDHVIPLSKGGAHMRDNLACCCRQCNCRKGAAILPTPPIFGSP